MRVELLDTRRRESHVEVASVVFEYLEIRRNRQRRHTVLGMLEPVESETRLHETTPA